MTAEDDAVAVAAEGPGQAVEALSTMLVRVLDEAHANGYQVPPLAAVAVANLGVVAMILSGQQPAQPAPSALVLPSRPAPSLPDAAAFLRTIGAVK